MNQVFCLSCIGILLAVGQVAEAVAQEEAPSAAPRLIELSTRGLPVSGTLSFVDAEGVALKTVALENERYFWSAVPDGAAAFELSTPDGNGSEKAALIESGSTFVNVNPTRPVVSAGQSTASQSEAPVVQQSLTRLPLIEEPRSMAIVATGVEGWIFVGKLQSASDDSVWSSLYLLDSGTLKKPDAETEFPFSKMKASIGKTFTADFPLVLRSSESEEGKTGFPILRGGQSFEVLEVVRLGDTVRARVRVTGVSTS